MKNTFLIISFGIVLIGCNKDKVPDAAADENNFYQSAGNLLILKIGDEFEEAHEYNLSSTELINDSLNIEIESYSDGMYQYNYWKYLPNPDTLFWSYSFDFTFYNEPLEPVELLEIDKEIQLDASLFQKILTEINLDYSSIWSKVSRLDIVKTYRDASPNSNIGITRQVINEFDEELGFNVPKEIFILILVK